MFRRVPSLSIAWMMTCPLLAACWAQEQLPITDKLEPLKCGEIQRLHVINGYFLASLPSPEDLAKAKQGGIRTVIDLRESKEFRYDPAIAAKQVGLHYHNLPFKEPATLTDELFGQARKLLSDPEKKPVLMFCGSANRVGTIWLVHRVLDQKITYEQALKEAQTIGLRLPAYEEKARAYITRHLKN